MYKAYNMYKYTQSYFSVIVIKSLIVWFISIFAQYQAYNTTILIVVNWFAIIYVKLVSIFVINAQTRKLHWVSYSIINDHIRSFTMIFFTSNYCICWANFMTTIFHFLGPHLLLSHFRWEGDIPRIIFRCILNTHLRTIFFDGFESHRRNGVINIIW